MQSKSPNSAALDLTSAAAAPRPSPDLVRRPVPRQFLELVERSLLVRILTPFATVLVGELGFSLEALAASAQIDRQHVQTLWELLSAAPPELAQLRDDLLAIADASTKGGHEVLRARDVARVLDPDLCAESCAATAYLEHRAVFDSARPHTAGQAQTKSFATFQSRTGRPLPAGPECLDAFRRQMREQLVLRSRSDHFRVHEWRSGSERHFEIVYGKLVSAREVIGKPQAEGPHEVTAQVSDRSTERTHAIFREDICCLDISGYDWMKELIRRTFGEAYFGSGAHFVGSETVSLEPLAQLDAGLSVEDVPGLRKVEIQEITIDLGGPDDTWITVGARSDTTRGVGGDYVLRALSQGKPVAAIFLLYLSSRTRPVLLKTALPRKLDFDRRDPRVVQIVRDWLVARGFVKTPDYLRAGDPPSGAPGANDTDPELP